MNSAKAFSALLNMNDAQMSSATGRTIERTSGATATGRPNSTARARTAASKRNAGTSVSLQVSPTSWNPMSGMRSMKAMLTSTRLAQTRGGRNDDSRE